MTWLRSRWIDRIFKGSLALAVVVLIAGLWHQQAEFDAITQGRQSLAQAEINRAGETLQQALAQAERRYQQIEAQIARLGTTDAAQQAQMEALDAQLQALRAQTQSLAEQLSALDDQLQHIQLTPGPPGPRGPAGPPGPLGPPGPTVQLPDGHTVCIVLCTTSTHANPSK